MYIAGMKINDLVRLCSRFKLFNNKTRFYSTSSENVLKIKNRNLYDNLFPNISRDKAILLLNKSPQCVYAGFDPTADSLHVGNLLILMNLLHWQRHGHQTIAVLGGATGLIGDPSYRATEREDIQDEILNHNLHQIAINIETIYKNHVTYYWKDVPHRLKPLIILNNLEWYKNMNIFHFVKSIGKHFRMGTMLRRTSVEARLNSDTGMSFTEFTYPVFQAYDWLHLLNNYKCRFQIGGNDQMGNIMSGHELISRTAKKEVYGLTTPLITSDNGKKFGKSSGNVVWLSPSKSSSFQLFQFFVRTKDSDVEQFLKYFTFFPLNAIQDIMEEHKKCPDKWQAQKILAENVTRLVHGEVGLQAALEATKALYDSSVEALAKFNENELMQIFEGATLVKLKFTSGISAYNLAMNAKCFKTSHDALRIISAGGFYINNQRIINENEVMVHGIHILSNNVTLLRTGKRTYYIVKWT
ncbi:tyrosine--tRNA ligase, mitochondrial [Prorops nasuta]|uniref:tyrosine--tRNA ligase, mitochondrial n=1 Tax=Prorops nasuta TaxID=863751 RepID=UPI0034CDD70A